MFGSWITERPLVGGAIALVVLVVVAAVWLCGEPASKTGARIYYYDMTTGKLFDAERSLLTEVKSPSGAAAPRAQVFACKDCTDSADRFIGYLEQQTEAYRKAAAAGDMKVLNSGTGTQMKNIDGDKWLDSESAEARALLQSLAKRCPEDVTLKSCLP